VGLTFDVQCTRPSDPQTIVTLVGAHDRLEVVLVDGVAVARSSTGAIATLRQRPLANRRWYRVELTLDVAQGEFRAEVTTAPSASPGRDLHELATEPIRVPCSVVLGELSTLALGGTPLDDGHVRPEEVGYGTGWRGDFDGRIAAPELRCGTTQLRWDLSQEMDSPVLVEVSGADPSSGMQSTSTKTICTTRAGATRSRSRPRVTCRVGSIRSDWSRTTALIGCRSLCVPPSAHRPTMSRC